jgi:hypothetical protein
MLDHSNSNRITLKIFNNSIMTNNTKLLLTLMNLLILIHFITSNHWVRQHRSKAKTIYNNKTCSRKDLKYLKYRRSSSCSKVIWVEDRTKSFHKKGFKWKGLLLQLDKLLEYLSINLKKLEILETWVKIAINLEKMINFKAFLTTIVAIKPFKEAS